MADTFLDMAVDSPYPIFVGQTMEPGQTVLRKRQVGVIRNYLYS